MNDPIERRAAIDIASGYAEQLNGYIGTPNDSEVYAYARGLILSIERNINAVPSAKPDIIVCADCKHWICHDRRCGYWNHGVKPLDYCSYAERRTDD